MTSRMRVGFGMLVCGAMLWVASIIGLQWSAIVVAVLGIAVMFSSFLPDDDQPVTPSQPSSSEPPGGKP